MTECATLQMSARIHGHVAEAGKTDFSISENEDSEEETENAKTKTSKYGAVMHLIKANVGTGILAMPKAISNSGVLAGAIGLVLLGLVCTYCMQILVTCSKIVASKMRKEQRKKSLGTAGGEKCATSGSSEASILKLHQKTGQNDDGYKSYKLEYNVIKSLDFASTAENAFLLGPSKFRKMATCMRFIVNVMLSLTQFGFCCVYFLFIAQSVVEVLKHVHILTFFSTSDIMLLELPLLIVINFIPNLNNLTGLTTTAVALQTVGIAIMFSYFLSGESSDTIVPFITPVSRWPLYFGTAMFAFEGIGVVLPLENDMKKKKDFQGLTGVLNIGMCVVTIFYIAVGVCGYVKYGSAVKSSITFNLPVGCLSELIRLMFAFAIFLTYPLQMYVPFSFILPYLRKKLINNSLRSWIKYAMECVIRAIFVTFTFAIAMAIPRIDLIISLVGAFASTAIALILPPIIHIITIWELDIRHKKWTIGFDIFICLVGFLGLLAGSGTAILDIWKNFHSNRTNLSHTAILNIWNNFHSNRTNVSHH